MFEALQFIADWFNETIYQFVVDATAFYVQMATIWTVKTAVAAMSFAWDVAKSLIEQIGLSDYMASVWSAIPGQYQSWLAYLNIPDGVANIITAGATRIALRFVPGGGIWR